MNLKHRNLTVRRTASGLGLFTLRQIPARKRIIEYRGPVISSEEGQIKGGKYLFEIDQKRTIDGSSRTNMARYINHSCRPNAEAFITGRRIWIWSKRAIQAGEVITIHYGQEYFDEHINPQGCKCVPCVVQSKKETRKLSVKHPRPISPKGTDRKRRDSEVLPHPGAAPKTLR